MHTARLVLAAAALLTLAACASSGPVGALGPLTAVPTPQVAEETLQDCPPAAQQQAQALAQGLGDIHTGMKQPEIVARLGRPAHIVAYRMKDDSTAQLLLYNTPQTVCQGKAANAKMIPLVLEKSRLVGIGADYVRKSVVPNVAKPGQGDTQGPVMWWGY